MNIKDKIIIVTGASAGIGKATATLLSQKGAQVILVARSKDKLDELSKQLPHSEVFTADMSDPEAVQKMIQEVYAKYGRIDALINNAGSGLYGAIENVPIDEYRKILDLNVIGPLVAMKEVIPLMRKAGGGNIVNVSSMVSKNYFPFLGAYASTKYALNALSLTARAELEKSGIVVSVVYPGLVTTDFGKNAVKADTAGHMLSSRRREGAPEPDSPELIAEKILYALESGEAEVYVR